MWPLFLWIWIIGAGGSAVLFLVAEAENPAIALVGRVAFALWVSLTLLGNAVVFATQNPRQDPAQATRSQWWAVVIFGGVPVSLLVGLGMRRAYVGRRLWLVAAVLVSATLYVAFPLGFEPFGRQLHGLARLEHEHHVLDVIALLAPAAILFVSELRGATRLRSMLSAVSALRLPS